MIVIPENTSFIGELHSSGRIRIDGHFEGEGHVDGLLVLSKSCVWVGTITADTIVVEGTVEGEIIARSRLEIAATGDVIASITSPEVMISEGAKVTGDIRMERPDTPIALMDLRPNYQEELPPVALHAAGE